MPSHIGTKPALPDHREQPGMSTALLVACHAMQGLIAGSVARNGSQSLDDEDAQIGLVGLANDISQQMLNCVEATHEREWRDWLQQLADRRLAALTKLFEASQELIGAADAQGNFAAALLEAKEAIEDDEIPF